ncbi:piggyBac transposable element-derived protein 4-like [Engraulis encrasicolus]|uniref:piggyBac transposable element-derived protein 4-like n=1 Tax=Engraulis encrasicolus TaxID=184585 RepID=UPI002FCF10E4
MVPTGKVDYASGERVTKPLCVLEYNKKMGSVDNLDKWNTFVDCSRKTFKWYKKLFFYILDVAVFNSFVLHRQITKQDITYPHFRENLAHQLLEDFQTTRRASSGGRPTLDNPLRLSARHFPSLLTQTPGQGSRTRRRCRVCHTTTRRPQARKVTKYMCVTCDVALCVVPCFEEYHSLKYY